MNNQHIKEIEVKQFSDKHITQADRDNDARIDEWKKRQREASRRIICARLAQQQRDRVAACYDAYAARIGGAA